MDKIQIKILNRVEEPAQTMMFLAKLTQRGHKIKTMDDLLAMKDSCSTVSSEVIKAVAALPHGTIKRFSPITIAIVGASRRFLAQARTNQVGFNYVSASLQYSDYSGTDDFVVPYKIMGDEDAKSLYLKSCRESMKNYADLAKAIGNDEAGYAAPQGLRNILIMQGNHQSWAYFIKLRACKRNTDETRYVALRIWEELLKTECGEEMFAFAGPECVYGNCREGKFSCGSPMKGLGPTQIIEREFPMLKKEERQ